MTTTKLTTALALGLVATVAATGPALAAAPKHPVATAAKSAKSVKTVTRTLKREGMKRSHTRKIKRVNRALCSITYYRDGAVAICQDDIYRWWNEVYVDFYNDYSGWIYYGFFVS